MTTHPRAGLRPVSNCAAS